MINSEGNANIHHKKAEYVASFTMHGLTRIFTGTRTESIFWAVLLLCGISTSIVIVYGLIMKYLQHHIYTEIRSQVSTRNIFPSVTICDNQFPMRYFTYCGAGPYNYSSHCIYLKKDNEKRSNLRNSSKIGEWFNGIFNVTLCWTWGNKWCASEYFFKSLSHFNNTCFTFNWNGTLHDVYGHVSIEFEILSGKGIDTSYIAAIIHDPRIKEIDLTNALYFERSKSYNLRITKSMIKRLPAPFPSNCTFGKPLDIFPGKYTRRSCLESQNYIEMYKTCGDIYDYHKSYIHHDILMHYKRNKSIYEMLNCFERFSRRETSEADNCPFPCEELEYNVATTFHERNKKQCGNRSIYKIDLQYQHVDSFKVIEEKPLYTWDQLACEVGGLAGLVIGASVISLIEIMAYLFLCMIEKLYKQAIRKG